MQINLNHWKSKLIFGFSAIFCIRIVHKNYSCSTLFYSIYDMLESLYYKQPPSYVQPWIWNPNFTFDCHVPTNSNPYLSTYMIHLTLSISNRCLRSISSYTKIFIMDSSFLLCSLHLCSVFYLFYNANDFSGTISLTKPNILVNSLPNPAKLV